MPEAPPGPDAPGRLRILVLSSYLPGVGGGELQTALQVRTLAARGHRVRVLDLGTHQDVPMEEILDGVPVRRLALYGRPLVTGVTFTLRLMGELRRLLPATDVVHFNHIGFPLVVAEWMARRRRVPLIVCVWGSSRPGVGPFRAGLRRALSRRAARRATALVALGSETHRNLIAHGFPPGRIVRIFNGVELSRFGLGRRQVRPLNTAPVGHPRAISVGRLVPAKGYDLLLIAWRRVVDVLPGAVLVIVGEGPLRPHLEEQMIRLRLQGRVHLAGASRSIPDWLGWADAYVSSSRTEGMSNALLEALASGKAVVATRVGGAEDVVLHGETGLLVEPGSAESLGEALREVLSRSDRLKAMGEAARRFAEGELDIQRIVDGYERLYREAIREARAAD